MSWSGFKKNVGRATTQVMMKTGHVEKTSDREYEVEERRYRTLESASLRLQKEAKGYLDSLRAMTASQMRIAETIDAFYGESGAKDGVSRSYKQAVEDLDAETVKALDGPYRCVTQDPMLQQLVPFDEETGLYQEGVLEEAEAELNWKTGKQRDYTRDKEEIVGAIELMEYVFRTTVLEPINRFCAYFPDINECIKKRNHKMLDYDSMRSKVKKLTEKPDKDPGKLPRTEKETEMVKKLSLRSSINSDLVPVGDDDLLFPSPPKVLNGIKQHPAMEKIRADEKAAMESIGIMRRPSMLDRLNRVGSLMGNTFTGRFPLDLSPHDRLLAWRSSPSGSSPSPTVRAKKGTWASYRETANLNNMPVLAKMLEECRSPGSSPCPTSEPNKVPRTPCHESIDMAALLDVLDNDSSPGSSPSPTMRKKAAFDASTHDPLKASRRLTLLEVLDEGPPPGSTPSKPKPTPPSSSPSKPGSKLFSPVRSFSMRGAGGMIPPTSPYSTYSTPRPSVLESTPSRSSSMLRHTKMEARSPRSRSVGENSSNIPSIRTSMSSSKRSNGRRQPREIRPGPLFHPSELHDVMAPLIEQYAEEEADRIKQAKAAYEQLNTQLTDELPQLIDLRVPYLDPTFEALVKIQLRFCAEAYSRMAQVQQYLAAETRDQYASGDLDARVEDVLGQIRELSIAGTV